MAGDGVELRLTGDPRLIRDGVLLPLPASKKTRALLCYLASTGTPHRRDHLCDLLWDGPNDPRAELRWSLAKIRALLGEDKRLRVLADREKVGLDLRSATVDQQVLTELAKSDVSKASTSRLELAVALYAGEFLEGLELPDCYRYHHWCLREREAISRVHLALRRTLIERLQSNPEQALLHARALVGADPLAEDGHAAIVQLLAQNGRRREALGWYDHAHRLLRAELGPVRLHALDQARYGLRPTPAPDRCSAPSGPSPAPMKAANDRAAVTETPLFGRKTECALIGRMMDAAARGQAERVLFLTGEPGIGKSRLLDHLAASAMQRGWTVCHGRAFEAEGHRPYGIWIDALRGVPVERVPATLHDDLMPVRPDLPRGSGGPTERASLFDGVVVLLRRLMTGHPVVLLFDDIQWMDEASAELLHYVIRSLGTPAPVIFALAGRPGELEDNPAVHRLMRSLAQARRTLTADLVPLASQDIQALVKVVAPDTDATRICAACDGNPLLALTLACAEYVPTGEAPRSLDELVSDELSRLPEVTQNLLRWAATLGQRFDLSVLGTVSGLATAELAATLDSVERRRIVQPDGEDTYVFAHNLVQQIVYRLNSQPRRRILHRRVAEVLADRIAAAPDLAGDLARHAALCGSDSLVVSACRIAGERCLQLFANGEAGRFADLGLSHLRRLPEVERAPDAWITLLWVKALAQTRPGARPLFDLEEDARSAIVAAAAAGLESVAAYGHSLIAFLHERTGEAHRAATSTLLAAEVSWGADGTKRAEQLARSARCLLELEIRTSQARALLQEVQVSYGKRAEELHDFHLGFGLLARWDGDSATSIQRMDRALALVRAEGLRWREYRTLRAIAAVNVDLNAWPEVIARVAEMADVAAKLGDPNPPLVRAIAACAALASGADRAQERLSDALAALARADDQAELAYISNVSACHFLHGGQTTAARDHATRALVAARTVRQRGELAIARAILAWTSLRERPASAARSIRRLQHLASDRERIGARVAAVIGQTADLAGLEIPPAIPTLGSTTIRRNTSREEQSHDQFRC